MLLSALQSALAVVPCCGSNAGSSQSIKVLPCGPPYVVVDPFAPPAKQLQQQQNSTCAVVRLVPGLPASGVAMLRLPKGVRYNTVSGPTKNDTNVYVSRGLLLRNGAVLKQMISHALQRACRNRSTTSSNLGQQQQCSLVQRGTRPLSFGLDAPDASRPAWLKPAAVLCSTHISLCCSPSASSSACCCCLQLLLVTAVGSAALPHPAAHQLPAARQPSGGTGAGEHHQVRAAAPALWSGFP